MTQYQPLFNPPRNQATLVHMKNGLTSQPAGQPVINPISSHEEFYGPTRTMLPLLTVPFVGSYCHKFG
jgi:hypothetical protein